MPSYCHQDEHSAGIREIISITPGGMEKYGIECHMLGTSVPVEKFVPKFVVSIKFFSEKLKETAELVKIVSFSKILTSSAVSLSFSEKN